MTESKDIFMSAMNWEPPQRFIKRLQSENCWSEEKTLLAIEEYKKFMFLAAVCEKAVTPSEEIDQVWHLHILHMEDYHSYINDLGRKIYHGPTKGGKIEDIRYFDQYVYTISEYSRIFDSNPLEIKEVWPPPDERFKGEFVRIDAETHLIINKNDYPILTKIIIKILRHL